MTPEDANQIIDKLSEKLGEAKPLAEAVVAEFSKASLVSVLENSIGLLICVVTFVVFAWLLSKAIKDDDEGLGVFSAIMLFGALIFCIVSFCCLDSSISNYIAPHYYIIKTLVGK